MDIKQALSRIVAHQNLQTDEMAAVMRQIMTGEATPAQIGGFLMALRMKGETVDEITGAARVMRDLASKVSLLPGTDYVVDTCGTGGDGANLFNVSTAAAFVVAAAGGRVAKHGNRAASGATGSADVLEAAGVELSLDPDQVARCVKEIGVGFMFAQLHHQAMKFAIGPRRELAQRTVFNILGPLTNPANVKRQVIGVFSSGLCRPMAEVLQRLGSEHVMVLHADGGLDEISIAGETRVVELKEGDITEYCIAPEQFGIKRQTLDGLSVDSAEQSLALIQDAMGRRRGPYADKAEDLIALNAGAAIYVCGIANHLAEGVEMAKDAIGSGLAKVKISELAAFTACFTDR
ncbi:MAG: anthranilate phosphoribosyltransferase [Exilibacterium sp.]